MLTITQVDLPVGLASGFVSSMTVAFDTAIATNVEVINNGAAIRATTPAHDPGIVNVTVSDGTNNVTLASGYGYIATAANTNDRHNPGTANNTNGQPPPVPNNDRHLPGTQSGSTAVTPAGGASGGSTPSVSPAPTSR